MANHKATKKDIRQSEKRRDRNRYYGKTTRNAIRKLLAITDKTTATQELPKVVSLIDKLAKRNVIHKNKAGNLKSGITKRLNALA
jgi:small subunit ribosomal protein S20